MDILVLKKNDTIKEMLSKLDEEVLEVIHAATAENEERVAEEVFDTIQVCIGILDKLERFGADIKGSLERHNKKLLERGWEYEKVIHINVVRGEAYEG
ncbi:hypothetical protein [Fonticella tunisiensis]|uniref:Phosphoribosyl-ATP pyrophosphohydrolase n=1 Tax=Fonticella tunisiensis TaxID=1096341 RepID=A0A4R7KUK2_9CLOT|nr:hypothetical protein [Fonticella tunisiensis]TDT63404.1 phosphoribosyl-ATP pyrophosphohydrolase [Fonticella tunisiensis]